MSTAPCDSPRHRRRPASHFDRELELEVVLRVEPTTELSWDDGGFQLHPDKLGPHQRSCGPLFSQHFQFLARLFVRDFITFPFHRALRALKRNNLRPSECDATDWR